MANHRRLQYDSLRDYYTVLGVGQFATPDEIQKAFRASAKMLHPDRNKRQDATEQFQLLNEAYQVLREPASRHEYNQLRAKAIGYAAYPVHSAPSAPGRTTGRNGWIALLSGQYRSIYMVLGIVLVVNLAAIAVVTATPGRSSAEPTAISSPAAPIIIAQPYDPIRASCGPGYLIASPSDGAEVIGPFVISGMAKAAYTLEWALATIGRDGRAPLYQWEPLATGDAAVERATLASPAQTQVIPGGIRVRLRLTVGADAETCEITIRH